MYELLKLLEDNCKMQTSTIAAMLDMDEAQVKKEIEKYEKDGVILANKALINWDKTDRDFVTALIEVKVTPDMGLGFEKVAEKIWGYDEVRDLYLMSGGFDFTIIIEGKTLKEVSYFVAEKLAPVDGVISTATHFILKKYKDKGVVFDKGNEDKRGYVGI